MTRPEYAPSGLLALLTPQANTTVEPEFSVLMPPGVCWLNGRLLSSGQTIADRLAQYMANLDTAANQFGNAPIEALALACTGTGYVVGPEQEDAQLATVSTRLDRPAFSAATAVCDALACLQARTVVLISPYDDAVHKLSEPYWQQRGRQAARPFEISQYINLPAVQGFHPIYARQSDALDQALTEHRQSVEAADAVVVLGTGMPTLAAISRYAGPTPLMSCMLCLGWRAALSVGAVTDDKAALVSFLTGQAWARHLDHRLGQT
ncbi:MAG: hypothetical protein AB8C46_00960 [Burkholderiaceae bacterium]